MEEMKVEFDNWVIHLTQVEVPQFMAGQGVRSSSHRRPSKLVNPFTTRCCVVFAGVKWIALLEENKIIQLSRSVRVVKWSIDSVFPNLQGPLLNEKVIALIAYEFLALLIGNLIHNKKLEFIREFIRGGKKSDKIVIEQLASRHYSSYHKIYPQLSESEILINIILFRWLVYKVYLKGLKLVSPDSVYLEELQNRKTLIARSVDEAKRGVYYSGS